MSISSIGWSHIQNSSRVGTWPATTERSPRTKNARYWLDYRTSTMDQASRFTNKMHGWTLDTKLNNKCGSYRVCEKIFYRESFPSQAKDYVKFNLICGTRQKILQQWPNSVTLSIKYSIQVLVPWHNNIMHILIGFFFKALGHLVLLLLWKSNYSNPLCF